MKKRKLLISILTGLCVCLMITTLFSACKDDEEISSSTENTQTESSLLESNNEDSSSSETDSSIEDSSILDFSIDSSVEDSSSEDSSIEDSSMDSSEDNSSDSSMDSSDDSSSDGTEPVPHEHDFTLEVIENTYLKAEATCESKAVYYYACACGEQGETTFEYGSVLEHDVEQHDAQLATCTAIGWNAYETCSRCDYTTYAEIPATGHSHLTYVEDFDENGDSEGTKTSLCENGCGTTDVQKIGYTVTFTANGVTVDVQSFDIDTQSLSLPAIPKRNGYTAEWSSFALKAENLTIHAIYTLISYKIDYVLNGGSNHENNPDTYTIEADTISLNAPTKAFGSTFAGWFTTETFAPESKVTAIAKGSYGNVTLYAKWLDYRIENSDGFTIDYTQDTPIVFLKVPYTMENIDLVNRFTVSEGCSWALYADFVGWEPYPLKAMTLDVGINQAYIIVKHPNGENFTRYLLAIYRLDMLGYTFMNEEEVYAVDFVQEETELTAPETNPEKIGYHFDGWSVNGDIVTFPYKLTAITTFKAEYSPIVYTVNFNANNGMVTETERQYTIETGMTFEVPTRDYYTFSGWYDSATDEGAYSGLEIGVFGDYTFYATWTPIEYAITYHLDDGENHDDNPETYNVEDEWTFATPTKAGYTFMGWYANEELTQAKPTIAVGEHGEIDLYAKWEANLNTLHFDANSAPIGEMSDIQIRTDSSITLPDCGFTKAGYTFIGYATSAGGYADYQAGDIYTMGVNSEYTLYAVWTPNLNTLYFNGNGATDGTMSAMNIYTDDTDTLTTNAFTKEYYHFLGWSLTADGAVAYEDNADYTMGTESAYTLYAVWEADVYTITYELAGGINNAGNTTTKYTVESNTISLLAPTRAYYDFVEWQIDGVSVTEITAGSHGDVTVTAVWDPTEYLMTYNLNGGTNGANPETYNVEDEFTFAEPTRTAYTFGGWYTDEECTQAKTGIALGEHGEIDLYAKFTPIEYAITYHLDGGENAQNNPETYNVEDEFTFSNPTKDYYTFDGWFTDAEFMQAKTTIALGEHGEIDLYAKWTPIEYAITYHVGVGENDSNNPETYNVEDEFDFINLSKTGYTFDGWYTDEAFTQAKTGITLGEYGEINLYAKWTLITYAITYHLDGGTNHTDNPATYTILQLPLTLDEPYKSEHYFDGWYRDAEYTIPFTSIDTIGGSTVYAKFIASTEGLQYTLSDDQTSYSISGYTGTDTNVYLPDSYNGLPVTAIQSEAFRNSSITSIRISDSVTSIGEFAFYDCDSLTSVTIGDRVTSIGREAFHNTAYYNSVSNWKNEVLYIGTYLIKAKTSISGTYTIKEETTVIADYAFEGCDSLTSVDIVDSTTSIGYNAFANCSSLTSVYITDIEAWCNISFGNDCSNPFYYANNLYLNDELVTELTIPNTVTEIKPHAFSGCSSLTNIEIPDSVTSIGSSAFACCSSLTSVIIPNGVTSIGKGAFRDCSSLTNMSLPFVGTSKSANNGYDQVFGYIFGYYTRPDYAIVIGGGGLPCQYHNDQGYYYYYIPNSLKTVQLTDTTSIPSSAFSGCNNLMSITIPDSVTSIGNSAFSGCSGLISVSCPALAISYLPKTNLQSIIITSGDSIGANAFSNCSSLLSVEIPDSVTTIGECAFDGCSGLTSVVIPDSVTSIGGYAFYNCGNLTSVVIGDSVTSIGSYAFYRCSSLMSVTIPDSVTLIGSNAFSGCPITVAILPTLAISSIPKEKLQTVVITSGNEIASNAFYDCDSLTSVVIGNSVISIGNSAFRDCDSLTSVVIGNSVISIGNSAFRDCDKLVEVVNKSPSIKVSKGSSDNGYVGYYALAVYNSSSGVAESQLINDDGYIIHVDGDEKILIGYTGSETDLILPSYITKIYKRAFDDCYSLTSVVIGNSVTSIGSDAFYGCTRLTSVYITDIAAWCNISFSYYTANPLYYAKNLYLNNELVTELVIPDTVTEIKAYAFCNCSNLTSVVIPDSVTTIRSYAFYNCSSLTSVVIPDSVTKIDFYAFDGCSSLTSITVSVNNITYMSIDGNLYTKDGKTLVQYAIGKSATTFTIPDSVTKIGESAFYRCSSLTSVVIPDGVTSIGADAFYYCDNLTSVVIGNGVTSIGSYAFSGCSSLTSVYYKGTASDWSKISIGSSNTNLKNATRYYYSETEPTLNADGTAYDGNYWHYDADGVTPVVWVYTTEE